MAMTRDGVEALYRLSRGLPADLAGIADDLGGAGIDDGLALQLSVLDRWLADGETLGGFKAAFTSGPGRDRFSDRSRPFGYVLGSRILASGAEIERSAVPRAMVEPEICFTLGAPLQGTDVTVDEVRAAVVGVAPAFEVLSLRLPGRPLPLLAADNLAGWGIVVGEERDGRALDLAALAVEVTGAPDDDRVVATTATEAGLDDPYLSVARVCAALAPFGRGLQAGQRFMTGALALIPIERPGRWTATFPDLGAVAVTFT